MGTIATVCPQARNSTAFNKILCHSRSQAKIIKVCKWKYTERKIYRMPCVSKAILTSSLNWNYGPFILTVFVLLNDTVSKIRLMKQKTLPCFYSLNMKASRKKKKKEKKWDMLTVFCSFYFYHFRALRGGFGKSSCHSLNKATVST